MKPMLKSLMAAVFVFALALVMAAPAQAQPPETTTFEFTAAVFNTCNDDLTVINGQETITTRVTRLGQGRVRYDFRDVQSGTAPA